MNTREIEGSAELQRVLWACWTYWQREPVPPDERTVCYNWALGPYTERFGGTFHQSLLSRLAKIGLLKLDDTSRAGHRRYYKLVDPGQVQRLLEEWKMV